MDHFAVLLSALALTVVSGFTPSPLAAETFDEQLGFVRNLIMNTKTLDYCQAIGFEVDQDALNGKLDSLMTQLAYSGGPDGQVESTIEHAAALGEDAIPDLSISAFTEGNEALAFWTFEAKFQHVQQRCDELIRDPEFAPHIARGSYQAIAGPKSYFGLTAYQASHGDAEKMVTLGAFYAIGVKPDPDHKLEVMWYKKAAQQAHSQATARLAGAYFLGRGVDKDMIQAVKWAIITESLGGGSFERENIEASATPVQRKHGREKAHAWLDARR